VRVIELASVVAVKGGAPAADLGIGHHLAQRPAFLLGEQLLVGALGRAGFVLIPTRVELPDEALVIAVPHRGADNFHRLLGDDHQRRGDAHPILPRAVAFDSAQAVATVIEDALFALLIAGVGVWEGCTSRARRSRWYSSRLLRFTGNLRSMRVDGMEGTLGVPKCSSRLSSSRSARRHSSVRLKLCSSRDSPRKIRKIRRAPVAGRAG